LLAAWRFLDQPALATPHDVDAFWSQAVARWTPARLPPVKVLPVPQMYGPAALAGRV
jgi:hypothetical protein